MTSGLARRSDTCPSGTQAGKLGAVVFHTGASITGEHPRVEGGGDTARYMRLADLTEVEAAADDLRRVVAAWCDRP
jgi:hypothetical protein